MFQRRSRRHGRSWLMLPLIAILALLALPGMAAAQEEPAHIDGSPADVFAGPTGNLQARFDGFSAGLFYSPGENIGAAGLFLGFPQGQAFTPDAGRVWGPSQVSAGEGSRSDPYVPVSVGAVSGNGSAASPYAQVTRYDVRNGEDVLAEISQTVSYVNGQSRFAVAYDVKNVSGDVLKFRATEAADLYVEGNDAGTGTFNPGPPRFVGGVNPPTGNSGGIAEDADTPFDSYQLSSYSAIWALVGDSPNTALANTIDEADQDNGVAVQWDDYLSQAGLASDATARFEITWYLRANAALFLRPQEAAAKTGTEHSVLATLRDPDGGTLGAKTLRYTVEGANPQAEQAVTTDDAGQAFVRWTGANEGRDTVTAYVDLNGNSAKDDGEPSASAEAVWVADLPVGTGVPAGPEGSNADIDVFVTDDGMTDITIPNSDIGAYDPDGHCLPLSLTFPIDAGTSTVSDVSLILLPDFGEEQTFPMEETAATGDNGWVGALPCAQDGVLLIQYTLTENGTSETFRYEVGSITLIDPQGIVYDLKKYDEAIKAGKSADQARRESAVTGATVTLQRKVGDQWKTVLSGDPGIAPHVNPQVTEADGKYQWDVSAGQYRVVVTKDGYDTATTSAVTIPPPVLDLHVALRPTGYTGPAPAPAGGGNANQSQTPVVLPDTAGPALALKVPKSIKAKKGVVTFNYGPAGEDTTGTVSLKSAKKIKVAGKKKVLALSGTKAFTVLKGKKIAIKVKLSKKGKAALKKLKKISVKATVTARDARGNATVKTFVFTLKQ
jgi:hypothetical protein